MADITTYVLVSGAAEPEAVPDHSLFAEYDFDHLETTDGGDQKLPCVTFALQHPIDETIEIEQPIRRFSGDVPQATVVACTVEERFDQVERLQLNVYRNGQKGGDVEHGYIFNVGPG